MEETKLKCRDHSSVQYQHTAGVDRENDVLVPASCSLIESYS